MRSELFCERRSPRPKQGPAEDGDSISSPDGHHQLSNGSYMGNESTLASTKDDASSDDPCSQEAFLGDLAHSKCHITCRRKASIAQDSREVGDS